MALYSHHTGLCRLHTVQPPIASSISEFPSSKSAGSNHGGQYRVVPNQWHESIRMPPLSRHSTVSGWHKNQETLLDAMQQAVLDGTLVVNGPDGKQLQNAPLARKIVAQHLPKALQTLLDSGLLVS